ITQMPTRKPRHDTRQIHITRTLLRQGITQTPPRHHTNAIKAPHKHRQ
ncbi:8803_t:CDS:1, partial [Gigaspora rosea]